jgi:hypothetical protein
VWTFVYRVDVIQSLWSAVMESPGSAAFVGFVSMISGAVVAGLMDAPWTAPLPLRTMGEFLLVPFCIGTTYTVIRLVRGWGVKPKKTLDLTDAVRAIQLTKLLESDAFQLSSLVFVTGGCNFGRDALQNLDPYIVVAFDIFNSSVYTIRQSSISGRIVSEGQELDGHIELESNPHDIPHGNHGRVQFRQWLNPPVAAMLLAKWPDIKIQFSAVKLTYTAAFEDKDTNGLSFDLKFPSVFVFDATRQRWFFSY